LRYDAAMADSWDEDTTSTTSIAELVASHSRKRACLTIVSGEASGQVCTLARGATVVGRAPEAGLRLVEEGISRQHARVQFDEAGVVIEDLSRNGTFVNGERIRAPVALEPGDKIQIGRTTVLRFAYHDAIDESFHENLLSSALRDPLTRLFNKRYLMDRLDSELNFARRHETALSILMLDIDHFKQINDGHGHLAGDAVLVQLAGVLSRAVRNEDVVARFGGEELMIILRAIPIELAVPLGERLRRLVEATETPHGDHRLWVTMSIGAAAFPTTRAETVAQLVEAADQALYRAKHAGRNRVSR
jgi:two-component system, cell cycle response regulator